MSRPQKTKTPPKTAPVTWDTVRRTGLALPEVEESTSYGTPSLKVRGKSFCRLKEDGETIVLMMDHYERQYRLENEADVFFITDHYRDYPAVLVRLSTVRREDLPELLTESWRRMAPKRLAAAFEREGRAIEAPAEEGDAAPAPDFEGPYTVLLDVVRRIPPGRVLTYGDVAALAGLPGHARLVGYALHALPPYSTVPWHRVINHKGGISTGRAHPGGEVEQQRRLEAEGVAFDANGRTSLKRYRWDPDDDAGDSNAPESAAVATAAAAKG